MYNVQTNSVILAYNKTNSCARMDDSNLQNDKLYTI